LLENLLFTHGRGIYLMKTLMDEVSFEEGGSVVRIRKNSNFDATEPRRSE
jgi:serine/threonine-protein kinase RsbW